ncbi:MAG: dicarboxylate/amino acid:cation symporter [Planctomycetota bacterium]
MKLHVWVFVAMLGGVLLGAVLQWTLSAGASIGAEVVDAPEGGVRVARVVTALTPDGRPAGERLQVGDRINGLILFRGIEGRERSIAVTSASQFATELRALEHGAMATLTLADSSAVRVVKLIMDPTSPRSVWLTPFRFVSDMFMRLLRMLIVPLVVTSIITGVAGLGGGADFGRLGSKTFGYYMLTSLLAAVLGLVLVTAAAPGVGAKLGLAAGAVVDVPDASFADIVRNMVPENVVAAFASNGSMLQIILFSILFGFFISKVGEDHRRNVLGFIEGSFQVIMKLAGFVMALVPAGVFFLMVKVVGETGFEVFKPLGYYMMVVFAALGIHALVVLPLVLRFVGKVSPWRWAKAMAPALTTAFSTSSSSMTLPMTLETIEARGGVSNRTTSFVAPLGATVNMDGTALYECVGVVFLAQYYWGEAAMDPGKMITVVIAALLASIGAAGIPSAGLVLMLTILTTLGLPTEGAALLLVIDRPLDMCRTVVNVWSDTCGAAVIAASEGEVFPASIRKSSG